MTRSRQPPCTSSAAAGASCLLASLLQRQAEGLRVWRGRRGSFVCEGSCVWKHGAVGIGALRVAKRELYVAGGVLCKGRELCVGLYGHDADFTVHCCEKSRLLTCLSGMPLISMPAHACLLTQRCTCASSHTCSPQRKLCMGTPTTGECCMAAAASSWVCRCAGDVLGHLLGAGLRACVRACLPACPL
jgi:hypothetical protein